MVSGLNIRNKIKIIMNYPKHLEWKEKYVFTNTGHISHQLINILHI